MEKESDFSTKKFSLNHDCFLVKGSRRGAIYNLSIGDIYSIDENSTKILDQCDKGEPLEKIFQTIPELNQDEVTNYLESLSNLGLGKLFHIHEVVVKMPLPVPEIKLDLLWLQLTQSCNQECLHCYADSSPYINNNAYNILTITDWIRIINEAFEMGCRRLQFTGGEPLIFGKRIFTLIKAARDAGYSQIEIFTNSTLFDEEDIDLLIRYDVRVATNIYSKRSDVHDQITGLKGSFERTVLNVKLMKEKGVKVFIATVLMKQNEIYREETVAFMQEMGELMPLRHFDIVRPAGRGKYSDAVSEKVDIWSQKKGPIFTRITKTKFIKRKYGHSCWWGNIVVGPNGQVMPCIMVDGAKLACGDAKSQSLQDIIRGENLQRLWGLSKDKIKICRDCEYRYACVDCRPLAMDNKGDLYSRGDRCLYDPYQGTWKKPEERKEVKDNVRGEKSYT